MGPLVTIEPDGILYTQVKPDDVAEIVEATLKGHGSGRAAALRRSRPRQSLPRARRDSLLHAAAPDRAQSLRADRSGRHPRVYSRRRLCGGRKAGYPRDDPRVDLRRDDPLADCAAAAAAVSPPGRKWDLTRRQPGEKKYVICNGDEGDPGAFMDRSVMEGNPHSVIEGMMIAARAIGADEGYVYVRAEYPLAVQRVRTCGRGRRGRWACWATSSSAPASASGCRSWRGRALSSAARRPRSMASIEGERGMPGPSRRFPPRAGCGASRRSSTTWRPWPPCPW